MGRNTCAEKLQALHLPNCTLRYLHMTCYQHFISKTSMANDVRSKSGSGALGVGPRRFSGPNALCWGPAVSVSGALSVAVCVGVRGPLLTLCVSGPGGPWRSSPNPLRVGPGCLCLVSGAGSLSRAPTPSVRVCVGVRGPLLTLCVSGPGGPWRSSPNPLRVVPGCLCLVSGAGSLSRAPTPLSGSVSGSAVLS